MKIKTGLCAVKLPHIIPLKFCWVYSIVVPWK